ncbi:MAG: transketolase [Desulfocucumaceae bacterium]
MGEELIVLSNQEKILIKFMRELAWGEMKIRVENGQAVLIYEAIKTIKLTDEQKNNKKSGSKRP